ncbi:hypothetical protein SEPL_484 [Salmonella phage SE_PL]|nr:hypothetical protein 7t3_067 [Salmonella phage 7t3]QIG63097.1 hypothetical protein SEPL_484 [Salmonella phage SE_PL]
MSQAEITADIIITEQQHIEELRMHIKDLYQQVSDGLMASGNVVTKAIENLYKEIDASFNKKSKYEQNVLALKRQIFKELGVL